MTLVVLTHSVEWGHSLGTWVLFHLLNQFSVPRLSLYGMRVSRIYFDSSVCPHLFIFHFMSWIFLHHIIIFVNAYHSDSLSVYYRWLFYYTMSVHWSSVPRGRYPPNDPVCFLVDPNSGPSSSPFLTFVRESSSSVGSPPPTGSPVLWLGSTESV